MRGETRTKQITQTEYSQKNSNRNIKVTKRKRNSIIGHFYETLTYQI